MKLVFGGVVLSTLVLACGGGAKKSAEPRTPAKSACASAAENLAGVFIATEVKHVSEDDRPTMVRILTERCDADHWSDETVSCMSTARGNDIERCAKMFSEQQLDAVEEQLDRELPDDSDDDDDEKDTESADDPCGGGA
jgi:hypothetical protein